MFNKTTNPNFKEFGSLVYDDLSLNNSEILNFNTKNVKTLNLVHCDDLFIKVNKGVVMLLVSINGSTIKSFIINRNLNLKKGIYFNLISISEECEVEISHSHKALKSIDLKEDYTYTNISSSLNINEIYTKFYQEKGINYNFPGESHTYWELTYVDKGILSTTVDDKKYELKQGDLIFYAPLQFHTQSTLDQNSSSYLTINFNMDFNHHELLCNKVFNLQRDSHSVVSKLIEELSSDNIYSNDLSLCYLKQLIIQTLRLENSYFQSRPTTHMQQTYENNLLNEILQFIDNNLYEKISVDTLCRQFCISTSMLHSLFKKNMNNTVKNHINDLKLNKSKELIKKSTYTLSEISEMLGFSSIHYFSKKFKSSFGVSPTEYSKSIYN
ncbi:MAG: AraC family transcriptional regulator [Romboutsia sp.]|uniref:AraC family transcriptional regulator n=1 Tax=Romboutsia sp. TaxID=1965302 RepID=UPI003F3E0950